MGIRPWTLGILTFLLCNTKFSVMSKALRPGNSSNNTQNAAGRPDTEVPSYFWSELLDLGANAATSLGSLVSNGAGALGNLVSNVPVVGNVVDGVVTSLGNGLGQVVSGNFVDGLGSMYHGLDKAVGGFLPNLGTAGINQVGIAPAQGWVSSLYNTADQALYGALPNLGGGFGTTAFGTAGPSTLFKGLSGDNLMYKNVGGEWVAQAPVQSGGGMWDTAGKIANTGAGLASIYKALTAPKAGAGNTGQAQAQYRQMTGGTPGAQIQRAGIQTPETGSNVGTAVGGAKSRGQGSNETGDLAQVQAGVTEDGTIVGSSKDFEEMTDAFVERVLEKIEEESPSEENTRIVNRKKKKRGGATKGSPKESALRPGRRTG